MIVKKKRPDDQLDYDVEFDRWLGDNDAVQSAEAEIDLPVPGTPLIIESVQVFGLVVKVWLSGGISGYSYPVKVTATSTEGRIKEIEFIIRVVGC